MAKRTNEEWLSDLRAESPRRGEALAELGRVILASLPYALSKWLSPQDPRFAPLAEEVTQETIIRVMTRLDTFEGRSQFTTWVYKIAVRIALTELRRSRWKDVSLESLVEPEEGQTSPQLMTDPSVSPEVQVMQADMMARIQMMMKEELTDRQMLAMKLVMVHQMPMEEAARRLGSERNALYKLMHDARLRMKHRMAREGLEIGDILGMFDAQ